MNRYFVLLILLWQSMQIFPAKSQPFKYNVLNGALADATTALPVAGWGPNPANTGYLKEGSIYFYAADAYGISALRHGGTHLSVPLQSTVASLNVSSIGVSSYQQIKLQFAIARPLAFGSSRRVMVGMTNTLKRVAIDGYGDENSYGLSFGASIPLVNHLFLGLSGHNLVQIRKTVYLPQTLALGLAFQPATTVWLMSSIEQELNHPPVTRFGAQVHITKILSLQYGQATNPVKYALGAQIMLSRLLIHLAAERHSVLGWSPALSIGLAFMRRKDL